MGMRADEGWLLRDEPQQGLGMPEPKRARVPPLGVSAADAATHLPNLMMILDRLLQRPELNATENVWQFMRDNWLSNRIFKSGADLVDHCCKAWNKLVDQPWRIMSLGLRDWAHEF